MIALIIAMEQEADALIGLMKNVKEEDNGSGKKFYLGELDNKEVVIAKCGIGKVNAAYTTAILLERYRPDLVITTGTCGGFGLGLLDVFVASSVVQHDVDTTAVGDPKGLISGINKVFIDTDKKIVDAVCKAMDGVKTGVIASGDQFIADRTKAAEIIGFFGAVACDMESGAIGQVCYIRNTPFAVIRTVTDNGDDKAGGSFEEKLLIASEKNAKAVHTMIGCLNG